MKLMPVPLCAAASQTSSAASEARAVWLHLPRVFDADPAKGKEQVHTTVQKLGEHNFNLILPWITSDYLVALDDAEYRKKMPNAGWNSLGVLIEESARAGLSVDIWYAFTEYRNAKSSDYDPRVGGDPKWAALRINEYRPDPQTGQVAPRKWEDVCPQHPGARKWQLGHLVKVLQRYPKLGGIHIESPAIPIRAIVCATSAWRSSRRSTVVRSRTRSIPAKRKTSVPSAPVSSCRNCSPSYARITRVLFTRSTLLGQRRSELAQRS